jgi:hypothetical protein
MDRAVGGDVVALHLGLRAIQRDRPEGLLVLGDVVSEDVEQGFGLLRTEIDSLKVFHLDLIRRRTAKSAEYEHEVPHRETNLNAVGVGVAVVGGFVQGDAGLLFGTRLLTH